MRSMLIAVGVAGLLGSAGLTRAQYPDRIFPILELTDQDVAMIDLRDGSVADWEAVLGEPTLRPLDFRAFIGPQTLDPLDMDYRIWLAWHRASRHIYVAIERADNVYLNRFETRIGRSMSSSMYRQDHTAFLVDGDRSGGQFRYYTHSEIPDTEERKLRYNEQAQEYAVLPEVYDKGPLFQSGGRLMFSPYPDWMVLPPYADAGGGVFGENPVITVTEFYITPFDCLVYNDPAASVVSELYPGKVIGFAIELVDVDVAPAQWKNVQRLYGPGHSDYRMDHNARSDTFAQGMLLVPEGKIDDSAVEHITWARIKAQFVK